MKQAFKNVKPKTCLILILVFALILRLSLFTGLDFSDDMMYMEYANQVAKGDYSGATWVNSMRVGIIYPIGICFRFFGVNEFSAALYPLLTSLGSILLAFLLGRLLFNEKVGLLSSFLLALFPLNIRCATWPMPDAPVAFWGALAIYLFLKARQNKRLAHLIFSGLFIGIAYLHKVSGLIFIIFIAIIALADMFKERRIIWAYALVPLGILLIIGTESLLYFVYSGTPFARHLALKWFFIEAKPGLNTGLDFYPRLMLSLKPGLGQTPPLLANYGYFYHLIIPSLAFGLSKPNKRLVLAWFALLFLYLQFGSMSLTSWHPIHKLPRHLSVLTIPGLLSLAYALHRSLNSNRILRAAAFLVIFFLALSSVYFAYATHAWIQPRQANADAIYAFAQQYPESEVYADWQMAIHLNFRGGFSQNRYFGHKASVPPGSLVVMNSTLGEYHALTVAKLNPELIAPIGRLLTIINSTKTEYSPHIYLT
jgi:4-amino-4-deoxy-L-arabinose transferase-like glycosyltransferase